MSWHVVTDFDGTVTLDDLTNAILDRFADAHWRSIEAEWEAGRIGSRECMARQVALIRADPAQLLDFVAAMPVDPFFVPFVADCRRRGIPVTVASDGLDLVINAVLRRIGLEALPVLANRLVSIGDGRWRLAFPHGHSDCRSRSGTCKCLAAAAPGTRRRRTILIGDGRSDLCAAGIADYVFAKNTLLALCRERGIAHQPFETFQDAARLVVDLVDARPGAQSLVDIGETTHA